MRLFYKLSGYGCLIAGWLSAVNVGGCVELKQPFLLVTLYSIAATAYGAFLIGSGASRRD